MSRWPKHIEEEVDKGNQWISSHFFRIIAVVWFVLYMVIHTGLNGGDAWLMFLFLALLGVGFRKVYVDERTKQGERTNKSE